ALIRKYQQLQALERKKSNTNNNNNVYKTACIVVSFGLLVGCFGGILYLLGQNSGKSKYSRCKC
ncbi:hypothetical protein LCGC14_2263950, partial [marine sediment metagenome]